MADPKEKIRAWMVAEFEARIWITVSITTGDTPIENALFVALRAWVTVNDGDFQFRRCGGEFGEPEALLKYYDDRYGEETGCLLWTPQAHIENYRVDFAFYAVAKGGVKKLVVECDGHDFHERTKEQARKDRSRDRRLQELGYQVFRFTGSEIHADPMKCALQIIRWAGFCE